MVKRETNSVLKTLLFIPILLAIILLAACVPSNTSSPSIKILIPTDDPEMIGITGFGYVLVLVEVSNFKLSDEIGEQNVVGEGHIHYFLDVEPPTEPGKPAVTAPGTYVDTSELTYYWLDIGTGPHTFWVELVNNDHTPLSPPVIAKSSITAGLWDGNS